jgi:hypothetical protein
MQIAHVGIAQLHQDEDVPDGHIAEFDISQRDVDVPDLRRF